MTHQAFTEHRVANVATTVNVKFDKLKLKVIPTHHAPDRSPYPTPRAELE